MHVKMLHHDNLHNLMTCYLKNENVLEELQTNKHMAAGLRKGASLCVLSPLLASVKTRKARQAWRQEKLAMKKVDRKKRINKHRQRHFCNWVNVAQMSSRRIVMCMRRCSLIKRWQTNTGGSAFILFSVSPLYAICEKKFIHFFKKIMKKTTMKNVLSGHGK